jgi:hypothetical protein
MWQSAHESHVSRSTPGSAVRGSRFDETYVLNADSNTNISPGSPLTCQMALGGEVLNRMSVPTGAGLPYPSARR